jgi:hypothetical protein
MLSTCFTVDVYRFYLSRGCLSTMDYALELLKLMAAGGWLVLRMKFGLICWVFIWFVVKLIVGDLVYTLFITLGCYTLTKG